MNYHKDFDYERLWEKGFKAQDKMNRVKKLRRQKYWQNKRNKIYEKIYKMIKNER